jgi:hypothetical protein
MNFQITIKTLEEIATCIADCNLTADEACEYAKTVVFECCEVCEVEV